MSRIVETLWWLLFTVVSIGMQMLIPRIDALCVGVILLLQEGAYKTLLWIVPLFVFLQEGLGSRTFGGSLIWYIVLCLFFKIGERFFATGTFLFVFFLSTAIGCAYYGLALLLAPLQNLEVDPELLIDTSILQAIYVPCAWGLARLLRRRRNKDDEKN